MKINRRGLAIAAALATLAAGAGFSTPSLAQAFPHKPIRLVVAFGNGSVNDLMARDIARYMTESLGQSVVVDTRVGGGGSIATDIVAKAAPDGYTIGLGTSSQLVMNVGLIARTPTVLVASTSMPGTLKDVIAYAKANPGKVSYGSAGTGAVNHIFGAAFARAADVSLLHVPYKGSGPALIDLSGGHVNLLLDSLISTAPVAQQGWPSPAPNAALQRQTCRRLPNLGLRRWRRSHGTTCLHRPERPTRSSTNSMRHSTRR
jgi:tripartite-type tricarboxylate transporter receptor subunit TctC